MDNKNSLSISEKYLVPKGLLVAVGGNEDKKYDLLILSTIKSLVKKDNARIEVITTATKFPKETGKEYIEAFKKGGGISVGLMHISTRDKANDTDLLQRIKEADVIFFTGGDQLRITSILGGSSIIKEIRRRYEKEFCIIAGTSAGASAMSKTMIYGGESSEALRKGALNIAAGIGLIDSVFIDTHFVERGRFTRLMQMVSMNPDYTGIGLGEDSGVVIEDGHILKAIGNGLIVIMDGQHLKYTNVTDIENDEMIAIENLIIHTIVSGHGYDLREKIYLKPGDFKNPIVSENFFQ